MTKQKTRKSDHSSKCVHIYQSNAIVIFERLILKAVLSQSCLRKLLIMLMMLVC
jgi:hypothetical protein